MESKGKTISLIVLRNNKVRQSNRLSYRAISLLQHTVRQSLRLSYRALLLSYRMVGKTIILIVLPCGSKDNQDDCLTVWSVRQCPRLSYRFPKIVLPLLIVLLSYRQCLWLSYLMFFSKTKCQIVIATTRLSLHLCLA